MTKKCDQPNQQKCPNFNPVLNPLQRCGNQLMGACYYEAAPCGDDLQILAHWSKRSEKPLTLPIVAKEALDIMALSGYRIKYKNFVVAYDFHDLTPHSNQIGEVILLSARELALSNEDFISKVIAPAIERIIGSVENHIAQAIRYGLQIVSIRNEKLDASSYPPSFVLSHNESSIRVIQSYDQRRCLETLEFDYAYTLMT